MTRQEYLTLRLALKRKLFAPEVLHAPLRRPPGKPLINQLIEAGALEQTQVRKLSGAVAKQVDKPEPDRVRDAKEEILRRLLIEGQECAMGAIAAADSERVDNVSIGGLLCAQGHLDSERYAELRDQVDTIFYREQLTKAVGLDREIRPSQGLSGAVDLPDFEDFEVKGELGRGGMGVIYRAHQRSLDRPVALKVLSGKEAQTKPTKVKRFQREARALSKLRHPNIVRVLQVGEERGVHYIAMELVDGPTLEGVLDDRGVDLDSRLTIAIELAKGLAYAHGKGILHRDIKPANVLMATSPGVDDGPLSPKLADFGLARDDAEQGQLTRDGAIIGTPFYMAPEQIQGNRSKIGPHTDQFAFGVLLYEMIAGELPFHGTSAVDVYQKILQEEPIPLDRQRRRLPPGLADVVHKALRKRPEERYPSLADLAADLETIAAGGEVKVGGGLEALIELGRRHGVALLTGALVLIGALAAVIWSQALAGPGDGGDAVASSSPTSSPSSAAPSSSSQASSSVDDAALALERDLKRHRIKGQLALRKGQYNAVLEEAAALRELQADNPHADLLTAEVGAMRGRHQDVLTFTTPLIGARAIKRIPAEVGLRAFNLRATALERLRQHSEALACYGDALAAYPGNAELLLARANLSTRLRKYVLALADLTTLLGSDERNTDARRLRGLLYKSMNKFADAISDFDRYLQDRGDDALIRLHRAICLEHEGKLQQAYQDVRHALMAGQLNAKDRQVAEQMRLALKQRLGDR